jgi:hypothetical protein
MSGYNLATVSYPGGLTAGKQLIRPKGFLTAYEPEQNSGPPVTGLREGLQAKEYPRRGEPAGVWRNYDGLRLRVRRVIAWSIEACTGHR